MPVPTATASKSASLGVLLVFNEVEDFVGDSEVFDLPKKVS
jgi:hypothetical protein